MYAVYSGVGVDVCAGVVGVCDGGTGCVVDHELLSYAFVVVLLVLMCLLYDV